MTLEPKLPTPLRLRRATIWVGKYNAETAGAVLERRHDLAEKDRLRGSVSPEHVDTHNQKALRVGQHHQLVDRAERSLRNIDVERELIIDAVEQQWKLLREPGRIVDRKRVVGST